jgi:hypothetical protein
MRGGVVGNAQVFDFFGGKRISPSSGVNRRALERRLSRMDRRRGGRHYKDRSAYALMSTLMCFSAAWSQSRGRGMEGALFLEFRPVADVDLGDLDEVGHQVVELL